MKDLLTIESIEQAAELTELIVNNYTPEARLALCATVIESVASETDKPIGEIYDAMKRIAELIYHEV